MLTRNLSLHVRTLILPQKIGNESPGTFEDRSSVNLKTEITVIEIYSLLKLLAFKRRKKRKIICWHSEKMEFTLDNKANNNVERTTKPN
jgi:hypothetical protein